MALIVHRDGDVVGAVVVLDAGVHQLVQGVVGIGQGGLELNHAVVFSSATTE